MINVEYEPREFSTFVGSIDGEIHYRIDALDKREGCAPNMIEDGSPRRSFEKCACYQDPISYKQNRKRLYLSKRNLNAVSKLYLKSKPLIWITGDTIQNQNTFLG